MPNFEIPISEGKENKKEGFINNLMSRFPQLRTLFLATMATTASMLGPESLEAGEIGQLTEVEQLTRISSISEKITDKTTRRQIKGFEYLLNTVGSEVPDSALYSSEALTLNEKGKPFSGSVNETGHLPDSAENIYLGGEQLSGGAESNGVEFGAIKNIFYITKAGKGDVIEGDTELVKDEALSKNEALNSALRRYLFNKSLHVSTGTYEGATVRSNLSIGGTCFVKSYKIIEVKNTKIDNKDAYEVTVEIKGGQFTPKK